MFLPFEMAGDGIGMNFMLGIYLVFMIGAFIFYVKSVEIGSIFHTTISALFFIMEKTRYDNTGQGNWAIPLICMFLFFVIWSLTVYSVALSKRTIEG